MAHKPRAVSARSATTASASPTPDETNQPVRGIVLAACSWTAVLLILNRALFRVRLIETGDLATILYQVRDAARFHELLGNYSRWQFHHPGPGFMYVFALGDGIARRLLHLSPEPANSAYLTMLLLNVALLFLTIRIFARHCGSNLFLPAAMLASLWLIFVINRTLSPVATVDVWFPHMTLYVFLLFAAVCATVATGTVKDLPILVICGGLLVHGHAAQILFVAVLSLGSLAGLYVVGVRKSGVTDFVRAHGKVLIASLVLVLLFLAPILIDRAIDHPNNIHRIRAYLAEHHGERNSLRDSLLYEASFFTFNAAPDVAIPSPGGAHLFATAAAQPYILCYWIGGLVLLMAAVLGWRKLARTPAVLVCMAGEVVLIAALFLYWAIRITGPFYNFNGFFFYSVQFLILFLLIAVALDGRHLDVSYAASVALACAVPLLMFTSPASFTRIVGDRAAHPSPQLQTFAEEADRIVQALPRQAGPIRLRFPDEDNNWALAAGIASRLHWIDQPVCGNERWADWFEDRDVCRHVVGLSDLILSPAPASCSPPCRLIFQDSHWSAMLRPFPAEKLPFILDTAEKNSLNLNFYRPENPPDGPRWTKRQSLMRFLLSPDWAAVPEVRIGVNAVVAPGRRVQLLLNGREVGTVTGDGPVSPEFVVPREWFRAGAENELLFRADNDVGLKLSLVQFEPAE